MDLSRLGKLGVWTLLDAMTASQAADFARRIEALGYSALWHPEAVGRDPVALIGFLAPQTSRLVFATGIANIYARDPMTANAARLTLGEVTGGRFILGLGVSHAHLVAGVRKHEYGKPVSTMRAYLEAMRDKPYMAPAPPAEPPIVLAALRPTCCGSLGNSHGARTHTLYRPSTPRAPARSWARGRGSRRSRWCSVWPTRRKRARSPAPT
jgi:alkanesulfonate monooxygenase SsuD/methylene tetrahydromethanopterin reductase-like flavin-dependent oxidoreductase (luciferase family)